MFLHLEMFRRAASVFAATQYGMRFIDKNARAVFGCDGRKLLECSKITVHRVNSLDDHELSLPGFALERRLERIRIVMLEFLHATTRKSRAVSQAQMRTVIQNGD